MIHKTLFGLALLLCVFSAVALHGAIGVFSKDLFILSAQYFMFAILSFAAGGGCAWLKFELFMSGLRRWA